MQRNRNSQQQDGTSSDAVQQQVKGAVHMKKAPRKIPYAGPFGYDPMSELFWKFLIIMMVAGVCVHLQRVIYGWTMWNKCLDKNRDRFTAPHYLYDHCFWSDDSGRDGIWRFLHFAGGVFWMYILFLSHPDNIFQK